MEYAERSFDGFNTAMLRIRFAAFRLWSRVQGMPQVKQGTGKGVEQSFRWENVHSVVDPQIREDGAHIWPFDPSFPVDVRAFAFQKQRNIRLTRHDYFELLYVYSGEAEYQVQERHFVAKKNDLIVINGASYHRLSKVVAGPFKVIVLYFLPNVLRAPAGTGEDVQYLMPFLLQDNIFPNMVSRRAGLHAEIFDLVVKIQAQLPANTERARLAARTYLQMILILLINHFKKDMEAAEVFDRREKALQRMKPLFDFVETHYPEPIALATATAIVGMSKAHFMRSFKKVTGQSFDGYLNHFRIAKAQALLASSDKPILAVSREVGFSDQSYFGLVFRRLVRATPREDRRMLATC